MAAFECPRCKHQRSKGKLMLCNVCWLLDDLVEEHERAEHISGANPSCIACQPEHRRRLNEQGAGAYVRRVLSSRPLSRGLAKFLLEIDRLGVGVIESADGLRAKAVCRLRDDGHIFLTDGGVRVSAHSRYKAMDILAANQPTPERVPRRQGQSQRSPATSHESCTHERTPKARAQCRAARNRGE